MTVNVGIWTDGVDVDEPKAPWLAMKRMVDALTDIRPDWLSVYLIHTNDSADWGAYDHFNEIVVDKDLRGKYTLLKNNFDQIVLNGIPNTIPSLLFHTYPRASTIAWVHGTLAWVPDYAYGTTLRPDSPLQRLQNAWQKRVLRVGSRRCDRFVTASNFAKSCVSEGMHINDSSIIVNHYGIDHDVFRERNNYISDIIELDEISSQHSLLFVANYKKRKNPHTLLRASKRLHERGIDHDLVIVGAGYQESPIPNLATRLGIRDSVRFLGFRNEREIAILYKKSDVFVFPTFHENFGMPLVEAMASGCPVVATDHASIPEVVGDAGVLVDDPTDPEELADCISSVLTDANLRDRLIRNGRERSMNFSWEKCAQTFVQLFDDLRETRG